jgi:hypothetical protein
MPAAERGIGSDCNLYKFCSPTVDDFNDITESMLRQAYTERLRYRCGRVEYQPDLSSGGVI